MHCLSVIQPSQIAAARRLVTGLASDLGCDAVEIGKIALLVTEAATNLVKHATAGQLLVWVIPERRGIDLLALDQGPGMRNVNKCLRDGYSTAGSAGTGLGAITRLATFWDIHSIYGVGTALFMRWLASPSPFLHRHSQADLEHSAHTLHVGGLSLPLPGERACGDAWTVVRQAERVLVMVADGLGHGPCAAKAAEEAVRVVHQRSAESPVVLLEHLHQALQGTRGAAIALAEAHLGRQELTFVGLGNVTGRLLGTDKSQTLLSQNGIVGHQMCTLHPLTYPWSADALLLMYSDGLLSRWSLQAYPGLSRRYPSLIAGVLYRDFSRGRDDVSIVAASTRSEGMASVTKAVL